MIGRRSVVVKQQPPWPLAYSPSALNRHGANEAQFRPVDRSPGPWARPAPQRRLGPRQRPYGPIPGCRSAPEPVFPQVNAHFGLDFSAEESVTVIGTGEPAGSRPSHEATN
jgi:hypothetical protein